MSEASRLSYSLFEEEVQQSRIWHKWRRHTYVTTSSGSPAGNLPAFLINAHRVETVRDAEAYVLRLRAVERVMSEVAADLDARTRDGLVAPSFTYAPVVEVARKVMDGAPFTSTGEAPLWADFQKKVRALKTDPAVEARLLSDGRAALEGPFRRGYLRYIEAVEAMSKASASTDGVWRLPDGDAYYADILQAFTTTRLTPDQIHQIGLGEVARIQREIDALKTKVGFKGTLQEFLAFVKTDPQFTYPNTPEGKQQYLKDAARFIDRYMAAAEKDFKVLPKAKLEVRAVEGFRETTAPFAFYDAPAADGSRPGLYYVNLSDMTQVLKPQVESLAYHEGAPGHHFQIGRAIESTELPEFRREGFYGAYAEGWAVYGERLAKESGFFTDPYSDFGRLSRELFQASRLVLDTGIHAKRWSRDQALDYMRRNTVTPERDVVKEINRYIANPGQATTYKIGQLKILELREKAKAALGPRFDLREFHEVVLANGALPLGVLEQQVDAYIARWKPA